MDDINKLREKVMEKIDVSTEISDDKVKEIVDEVILEYGNEKGLSVREKYRLQKEIYDSIRGLDILEELLEDKNITEIMINGPDNIFIEKDGRIEKYNNRFSSKEKLVDIIQQIVSGVNRRVNESSPIVDSRLSDGSRVNVVLNPVAINGPVVTIRKFPEYSITMKKLIEIGSISLNVADFLKLLVNAKYNNFISGGTGSGKSSLVNLIPRFYDATDGTVKINGRDIKEYQTENLREHIGVVLQKAVLFKGSIADNLRWGKEDATEQEMYEALDISQAREFVDTKQGGLEFQIEQGGRNLSGGQLQRMTIARALVRKPEILILDDSASALDFATDAALRKSIKEMKNQPTVFIVSQRAASIQHADQIIVLDDGAMAGIGTHEELLKDCPIYQEIYYSQFPKEAVING